MKQGYIYGFMLYKQWEKTVDPTHAKPDVAFFTVTKTYSSIKWNYAGLNYWENKL